MGERAGQGLKCVAHSKQAKTLFSFSASDALRSPVVVGEQPLKLLMS